MSFPFILVDMNKIFKHFYGGGHRFYGWCKECNEATMKMNKERLLKKYGDRPKK